MADIENEIFTGVSNGLTAQFPNITVKGITTLTPKEFPTCYIEETDNYTDTRTITSPGNETHAVVTYEANVFTKGSRCKTEAKAIIGALDAIMLEYGFIRTTRTPIPTADTTVYRYFTRYAARVSEDKTIYRR